MGLTKQYLRYAPVETFGLIASSRSNVKFINVNGIDGRYIAVGGAEYIIIWDLKTGDKIFQTTNDNRLEVCHLAGSPDLVHIAIGLSDGSIEIYNFNSRQIVCRLALHRSAINCLRFDESGLKLASGGLDTDIVISDIVSQTGKSRLVGHKGAITDICFTSRFENILISSSKDTQVLSSDFIYLFFFFCFILSFLANL